MATVLQNVSRRTLVAQLDHPAFRSKQWGFKRKGIKTIADNGKGLRSLKTVKQSLLGALTLFAGETTQELPDAIVNCTQIRTWIREGLIVATKKKVAAPPPTTPRKKREE